MKPMEGIYELVQEVRHWEPDLFVRFPNTGFHFLVIGGIFMILKYGLEQNQTVH